MSTYKICIYIYICIPNRAEWLRFWIDSESRCNSSRFDIEHEEERCHKGVAYMNTGAGVSPHVICVKKDLL